jgi:hypothetical protein
MGAAGLVVSSWYAQKRTMQNAADLGANSAILSLRISLQGTPGPTTDGYAKKEAKSSTAYHGFTDGTDGTVITVNVPPQSGAYKGNSYNNKAVEVIVTKPASLLFASLFLPSAPTVKARSVAVLDYSQGDCFKVMDPHQAQSFQLSGTGTIHIGCGTAVDSDATASGCSNANSAKNAAAYINGSATVTTTSLTVKGNHCVTGSGTFNAALTQDNTNTPSDPYANASWQNNITPSGTNYGAATPGASATLQPGRYSSITISSDNVTFAPGTYFVEGGNFSVTGLNLSGSEVTIVLTHATGSTTVGTFTMQGNASIGSLTTPSSGTYAGMAIIQDPAAAKYTLQNSGNVTCGTNCNTFQGIATSTIVGAVYIPKGFVSMKGAASNSGSGCTQFLADIVSLSGTPSILVNNCDGTGVQQFGPISVRLAE